ncbi:hypothetical protein TsFJ059_002545 [Trichoderma semiorbis]|uniref:C2H2-type domain-containing protein n=1 Tax=Trichoderma semiorbis TaxID=1491008 RepID=A0A9P8HGY2_9HYPO|nr:hypothetical protein TsFJ059_002545 [Trichoderma semiorbis]
MQQVEAISWTSHKGSTKGLSSSSITELCQQCTSAFETCTHHESLIKLKREWAGERFFDFNIYINCIGVRSASRAFLDYRLDSGQSTRLLLSNILTMLKKFLAECTSCAEAQSGIDAATKKVDTSIKCLSQIMEAIIRPGIRSRLPQGDFQNDVLKLNALSTEECIKISEGLKLSKVQQQLLEVNLRRRNRFLQAQERDQQESVDDPTKASTTQGNSWFQEAEKKASQLAMMALTAVRPADRYPRAPKLPQGATAFKCPCCCETLPAEFANDDKLWREHIFEDISPYTCILPDCPTPFDTYTTIPDWETHFKTTHRRCYVCKECKNHGTAFPGLAALAAHIRAQHAESASPDSVETLLLESLESPGKTIGTSQCPLCDLTGLAHSQEFIQHVLGCVHDFSLYSLPWDRLCQD